MELKPIIRTATEQDLDKYYKNLDLREDAVKQCKVKVLEHNLDMKIIDAEYTFDGTKIIFYFSAEGRVDFRELVKDLGSLFKMRIELRQVGVRDEARLIGDIGTCGRALCCASFLSDFQPVSIKMAKVQNLSLNPTKISGSCGRLMCCLKYENDVYKESSKGMPSMGELVETPEGLSKVVEVVTLKGEVRVRTVLEERTDTSREKLSNEVLTFSKDEITRQPRGQAKPPQKKANQGDAQKQNQKTTGDSTKAKPSTKPSAKATGAGKPTDGESKPQNKSNKPYRGNKGKSNKKPQ
jgi:cell fate regulator YaaT (PSP1 superfamily)